MCLPSDVFAIIGRGLYAEVDPGRFGNLGVACYTLFQLMTLDDWFYMYSEVAEKHPGVVYMKGTSIEPPMQGGVGGGGGQHSKDTVTIQLSVVCQEAICHANASTIHGPSMVSMNLLNPLPLLHLPTSMCLGV